MRPALERTPDRLRHVMGELPGRRAPNLAGRDVVAAPHLEEGPPRMALQSDRRSAAAAIRGFSSMPTAPADDDGNFRHFVDAAGGRRRHGIRVGTGRPARWHRTALRGISHDVDYSRHNW